MRTTLEIVRYFAAHAPAKPAVRGAGETRTYRDLLKSATAIARELERERIGVLALAADNGPEWIAVDLAAQLAGAVLVPLPGFFSAEQLRHAIADSGAAAVIADADFAPRLTAAGVSAGTADHLEGGMLLLRTPPRHRSVPLPADTAKISYTSGTTGRPKGVCLAQAAMDTVAQSVWCVTSQLDLGRHLCVLPLATLLENVAGIYAPLRNGAEIVVPRLSELGFRGSTGIDARALLGCLARYRPSSIILLPQILAALVDALENGAKCPGELKFAAVGGARVAKALLERADRVGLPVYEGYGLTECASVVALNSPLARRAGSVGRALPHARLRVDASGEIHVSGAVMAGYVGSREPELREIATGDLGRIDADGFVEIEGRRKNVFITSFGRNVSPDWVEAELMRGPPIAQAAVFGEARPWNVAVIVPTSSAVSAAALHDAITTVNSQLPDYARVADWIRADEPFTPQNGLLTANGRNRRTAIWNRYGSRIDASYSDSVGPIVVSQGEIA